MRPNNLEEFIAMSILLRNSSRDTELKNLRLEVKKLNKKLNEVSCGCCEEPFDMIYGIGKCGRCDKNICDECINEVDICDKCELKCINCDKIMNSYCQNCPELICMDCCIKIKCVCGKIETCCGERCCMNPININFKCPCGNNICKHLNNNKGCFICPICDTWYCDYCDASECSCGVNIQETRCSNCNYYISLKEGDLYCCKDCGDIKCEDCSLPYICEC